MNRPPERGSFLRRVWERNIFLRIVNNSQAEFRRRSFVSR